MEITCYILYVKAKAKIRYKERRCSWYARL